MGNVAVSIIVPCYNVAPYLERCINSILRQSYNDFEVILVNDGSTDATAALCDKYATMPNVVVIRQDNRGVSAARNSGLARAAGQYIMFVDADDSVEVDLVEQVMRREKESQADAVFFGFRIIAVKDGIEHGMSVHCPSEKYVLGNSKLISQVLPLFIGISAADIYAWYRTKRLAPKKEFSSSCRFLYKKDILDRNNIVFDTNVRLSEDTIFNARYLSCCDSFATLSKCLYNYYQRESGSMKSILKDGRALSDSKLALLVARENIKNKLKEINNVDISELYAGSNVLSAIQLAAELSGMKNTPFKQRFQWFLRYASSQPVRKAVGSITLQGSPMKFRIPVKMRKFRAYLLLFCGIVAVRRLGIHISV